MENKGQYLSDTELFMLIAAPLAASVYSEIKKLPTKEKSKEEMKEMISKEIEAAVHTWIHTYKNIAEQGEFAAILAKNFPKT